MRLNNILIVALFGAFEALANPLQLRQAGVCPGLYSNPQCCATSILGVTGLNCNSPTSDNAISSLRSFMESCAKIGEQASCCVIPIVSPPLPNTNPTHPQSIVQNFDV